MPNNDTAARFADALIREVPVSQLAAVLDKLDPSAASEGNGSGCGNGCGGNCGGSIDEFGYLELTGEDRKAVLQDKGALRKQLASRLQEESAKVFG